jgi:hypothetical protein
MQTNIVIYVDQNSLQFITGNKSLDKDWDYVKSFDNLNLNGYLQQMQMTQLERYEWCDFWWEEATNQDKKRTR